jgi:hypothetical protein
VSSPASAIGIADGLTREYLLHHRVCPIGLADDGAVRVAAAPDALLDDAVDDLRFVYGRPVQVERTSLVDVERAIERLTTRAGPDIELAPGQYEALEQRQADNTVDPWCRCLSAVERKAGIR